MDAKLVIVGGRANRREVPLALPTVIGRSHEATLTIGHPQISRKHCMIFAADGLLYVRDLGSTNGTFFDGNRILEAALLPDRTFTIGPLTFRVSYQYDGDVTLVPPPQLAPPAHAVAAGAPAVDVGPWSLEPAALDSQVLQVPIETGERPIGPPADFPPPRGEPDFGGIQFEPVDDAEEPSGFDFSSEPGDATHYEAADPGSTYSEPTEYAPPDVLPAADDEEEPEPTPPPNIVVRPQVKSQASGRRAGKDDLLPGSRDEITLDDF